MEPVHDTNMPDSDGLHPTPHSLTDIDPARGPAVALSW
jgi:hypothetical protein